MTNSQKVEIMIKGSQGYSNDDMASSELLVMGTLKRFKHGWIVSYENENNGLTKIVLFNGKTVIIKANGNINYYFRLSEGKNTKAIFKFQEKFSYMSIHTNKIECEMAKEKKNIKLCYDLEVDSGNVLKNKLFISIELVNS